MGPVLPLFGLATTGITGTLTLTKTGTTARTYTFQDAAYTVPGLELANTFAIGTITTSQPNVWTQTWNASGVTFTAKKTNITNTASAAGSIIEDWQIGGTSVLNLQKDGRVYHLNGSAPSANTFSGNLWFGCNNGTAAITGQIGELVESKISTSQNAAGTGTYLALTSISLTAGEWDICATAEPRANGATFIVGGQQVAVVGTTSASASGSTSGYSNALATYQTVSTTPGQLVIPRVAVSLTGTTTYYLNVHAEFSVGTPQWRGSISARRVR